VKSVRLDCDRLYDCLYILYVSLRFDGKYSLDRRTCRVKKLLAHTSVERRAVDADRWRKREASIVHCDLWSYIEIGACTR